MSGEWIFVIGVAVLFFGVLLWNVHASRKAKREWQEFMARFYGSDGQ